MTESAFTLDELKTAFALRVMHMVMAADEIVRPEEVEFIQSIFDNELLESCGFLDLSDGCFTQRFSRAITVAPATLARSLGKHEKLGLLDLFFKAAEADDHVDPREVSVVLQAARMLGIGQDELLAHLATLMGAGEMPVPLIGFGRRDSLANAMSNAGTAVLTITQDQLHDALGGSTDAEANTLRQRVESVLTNQNGRLIVTASRRDAGEQLIHGWHALVSSLVRQQYLLDVVRRLDLQLTGFDDEGDDLYEVPEARGFLDALLDVYPWLPVWLDPHDGMPAQMLATRVTGDIRDPDHVTHFLLSAVQSANYAVALSHKLGAENLDHIYEFLQQYGIDDIPPGYFDGVDTLESELDPLARISA